MYVSFVVWFLGSREKKSIIGEPVKARAHKNGRLEEERVTP